MSSVKTLYAEDSEPYLNELINVLTEDQQYVVDKVFTKTPTMCRDEIATFALSTVLDIKPIWMYGTGDIKHFFIHPFVITEELKKYDEFINMKMATEQNDDDEVITSEKDFDFTCNTELASFVTLKNVLMLNNISKLEFGSTIDSLYMPIYWKGHCSMLILSIPRRKFLHLDSIHNEEHRVVVMKIHRMFVMSNLMFHHGYRIDQVWTRVQSDLWECGWCALLFAEWWRNSLPDTTISDARAVSLSLANLSILAKRILEQQRVRQMTLAYNDRLTRAYGAVVLYDKA